MARTPGTRREIGSGGSATTVPTMIIHMHRWYSLRMILQWQWFSRKILCIPDNLGILSHPTFQFGHSGGTIFLFSIF
uniref:Uncharacterized protein n=1 Tax=Oryza glumipatula TaxID=40148 RepID=A0A0E0AHI3_9ORYZ